MTRIPEITRELIQQLDKTECLRNIQTHRVFRRIQTIPPIDNGIPGHVWVNFPYMISVNIISLGEDRIYMDDAMELENIAVFHSKSGIAGYSLLELLAQINELFEGRWVLRGSGIFRIELESDYAYLAGHLCC